MYLLFLMDDCSCLFASGDLGSHCGARFFMFQMRLACPGVYLPLLMGLPRLALGLACSLRFGMQSAYFLVGWAFSRVFSLGELSWLMLSSGPHLFTEGEDADPAFMLTATGYRCGSLGMLPPAAREDMSQMRDVVFSTIVSITLWFLWKARCSHILSRSPSSTIDICSGIWQEVISSLRSQWDLSDGSSGAAEERRAAFLRHWSCSQLFFSYSQGHIEWPPQWFILHSSH